MECTVCMMMVMVVIKAMIMIIVAVKMNMCDITDIYRAGERTLRPRGKRERRDPLREMRAENFQGLEINFGKLLLVYFMRPPDLEVLGDMRSLGACGLGQFVPCPLSVALLVYS